jgi:hypothetical protein
MTASALSLKDARKIGFNEPVEVEGRNLHIQTEVLTRDGVVFRTVVLEGGVVRFTENRACPEWVADLPTLVACVKSQHEELRETIRRGGSWLAST